MNIYINFKTEYLIENPYNEIVEEDIINEYKEKYKIDNHYVKYIEENIKEYKNEIKIREKYRDITKSKNIKMEDAQN